MCVNLARGIIISQRFLCQHADNVRRVTEGDRIRTKLGYSTADQIVVRGRDLTTEILGKMNLGDFAYLHLTGREPQPAASRLFNAIVITLVEHGITPSALAARLTYAGAPESLQGAVAAGLCGLGSVYGGTAEGAAKMLAEAIPEPASPGDLRQLSCEIVANALDARTPIPGIGHPIHKPQDPRAVRLFELATETGFSGPYVELMSLIAERAGVVLQRALPVNATGAIGALSCELGLPWQVARGLVVMARAIGLVGHVLEESERPFALEIWRRADSEALANALDSQGM